MKKSRRKTLSQKKTAKDGRMKKSGDKSRYARKREFLNRNGGFGFEYAAKPWK